MYLPTEPSWALKGANSCLVHNCWQASTWCWSTSQLKGSGRVCPVQLHQAGARQSKWTRTLKSAYLPLPTQPLCSRRGAQGLQAFVTQLTSSNGTVMFLHRGWATTTCELSLSLSLYMPLALALFVHRTGVAIRSGFSGVWFDPLQMDCSHLPLDASHLTRAASHSRNLILLHTYPRSYICRILALCWTLSGRSSNVYVLPHEVASGQYVVFRSFPVASPKNGPRN